MVVREGVERLGLSSKVTEKNQVKKLKNGACAVKYAVLSGKAGEDLSEVVPVRATLPEKIQAAILTLVKARKGGQE